MSEQKNNIDIKIGNDDLVIQNRYEVVGILNDILIAVWFFIGSIFFFFSSTKEAGVWLFVIGSSQMMIRPIIKITHKIHLQKNRGQKHMHL